MKYQILKANKLKLVLVLLLGVTFSHSFAGFEIKKYTINNGGSTMTSARFKMTSSIAQTDASNTMSSANYSINGGLWHAIDNSPKPNLIFNNSFE